MDEEERNRLYLQEQLETAFPELKAWYQPPGNIFLQRPCIVYKPLNHEPSYSNNITYVMGTRFQVTILSDLPGYGPLKPIFNIPNTTAAQTQSFVAEDVANDVFTLTVNTI